VLNEDRSSHLAMLSPQPKDLNSDFQTLVDPKAQTLIPKR